MIKEEMDSKVVIPQKLPNQGVIFSDYRRGIHTDFTIRSHFLRIKYCQTCKIIS